MWPTKQLIFWAIVATACFLWSTLQTFANEETKFVVTAYYSPLPDQSRYTTGSYAWDIRLNWWWVTTASWKWVFQGLLAGPKNYPFGTKIYFEGLWIGSIEDRWWAIVKAWERWYSYDRIDIWMGYWDEGLARALKWGKRTITGKIVVPSAEVSLSFPESKIGYIPKISINPEIAEFEDVVKVQEIFTKAELYTGEIDGQYESIKNELIAFQIEQWIIENSNDEAAWWFWPKTIWALRNKFPSESTVILREEDVELFRSYNHKNASEIYKVILEYGDLQVTPDSNPETVKLLQELMKNLWEYSWSNDGKYKSVEWDLIRFQKKIGLIEDASDWGAWYFWNKTKSALWTYYETLDDDEVSRIENNLSADSYILSEDEKSFMQTALVKIKAKLERDERRWGTKASLRLKRLSDQIEAVKDKITDPIIKAKVLYLREIL